MKPLFDIISDELLQTLQKRGRTKTYKAGEEILGEGETAEFLPIVLTGKVKMIRFLEAGKEVIIGVFGRGEMFAVPPVFDGEPYPGTAVAMEKTKMLLLSRSDFLQMLRESSDFSFAVISWMSEMLREKTAAIKNLAIASPEQRAGNVLLRLVKMETAPTESIIISLRRQDIAEMAALTTETTIRAIRKLADKNLVKIERGKIIIDDVERLRAYLAD